MTVEGGAGTAGAEARPRALPRKRVPQAAVYRQHCACGVAGAVPRQEQRRLRHVFRRHCRAQEGAAAVEILPAQFLRADLLLHAASAETMPAYSLALHLFDLASGEKAAQGDRGLWLGRYNPIRSEIDISALPAGEYELRIGLYEWQTLARVIGVDQQNGWRGEMLPLYRFEVK